jgi:putative ATP-dependent endonuclease of the OLD family
MFPFGKCVSTRSAPRARKKLQLTTCASWGRRSHWKPLRLSRSSAMYLSSVEVCGYRASAQQSLTCVFPGRFSVLLGPNSGGKTTICDAIYLAHSKRFPTLPRPTSDSLGILPREIAVKFSFEDAGSLESELGQRLQSGGDMPPSWERRLLRDLGSVRSQFVSEPDFADNLLVLTLPATRNPLDELARRESRSLIELLRAEQQRRKNHRNLVDLRTAAEQTRSFDTRCSWLSRNEFAPIWTF